MNIGLLLCDDVRDHMQPEHGNYPDMFQTLLEQQNSELQVTTYRALDGELPKQTNECDGWLISGSRHSVNDPFPWIAELEDFVKQLYLDGQKTVGICFGHQLMAKALGGNVIESEKGWGVGLSKNTIVQPCDWMQPELSTLNILVSHKEQVERLPDVATVVAASEFCPYYMLTFGNHFLSIQGHPEFTPAYSVALIKNRQSVIPQAVAQKGIESVEQRIDSAIAAQWILNFLRRS